MNYTLALRMVGTVLPQMAVVLNAPALKHQAVRVTLREQADTASIGDPRAGQPLITFPTRFCAVAVEADNLLYLGLIAHEIGHVPDLAEGLDLLQQAQDTGGPRLKHLLNLVEDIRIESAMAAEPVNAWLTRVREAVHTTELVDIPETLWPLLLWLRFGNPPQAYNVGLPGTLRAAYDDLCMQADERALTAEEEARRDHLHRILGFWPAVLGVLRESLPQGVSGSYAAAQAILALAEEYAIPVDDLPEGLAPWLGALPDGEWGAGTGSLPAPQPLDPGGYEEWQIPHDVAALAEGQRLARRLTRWWTQAPTRRIAGGVGKYNPRLEGRGIPPFTLPLARQSAPPPKLAVFLDVSGSMWDDAQTRDPLHLARAAAVAVAQAVKQAGGQVKLWAFSDTALYLGDDLTRACAARGGGTYLDFLEDIARTLDAAWSYLFITDAVIDAIPAAWDRAHQVRSAVIYIPDGYDRSRQAAALGQPVLTVKRLEDLPHLTALAARRFFAGAVRG